MCDHFYTYDILITTFYSLILLIPGYFVVKLVISVYFKDLREIIIYSLICCICYVVHSIINLSENYKQLKSYVLYLKH